MRVLKTLTGAMVVAMAFATANQANCQMNTQLPVTSPLVLTVNGTVEYQKTEGPDEGSIATYSLNEKAVYLLVSNYVANAQSYSYTNIAGTNLPADGCIALDANRDTFYVTNKTGFYYPLRGFDASGQYYSWIELDSFVFYGYDSGNLQFGNANRLPFQLFNTVADYKFTATGDTETTSFSTAVLYIHDDPYNYDDADNPYVNWENDNPWQGGALGGSDDELGRNNSMIEIRGVLMSRLHFINIERNLFINNANLSLSGSGNFYEHDLYNLDGVLISGQASLATDTRH